MTRPLTFARRRQLTFGVILLFGLLAMTARNASDPDLWWHLRTGRWIVEHGQVPHSDPFSFTRNGAPWISHEWLSEVIFFELWRLGGAPALIVFSALITTAGFLLLFVRNAAREPRPQWAAVWTVFAALVAAPSWGTRPQMFTFLMASALLCLVEAGEKRPRLLLGIPPLFLLWLNLHAGFALGPVLLAVYLAGLVAEAACGSASWEAVRPVAVRIFLLLMLCLALVPLNPSGAELYHYPFDTLRSPGMRSFIVEWSAPDFHRSLYQPFLLAWLLLMAVLAVSRFQLRGRELALLLLTAFAGLDAVRHIPIFVLVAIPVLAAATARANPPHHSIPLRPGLRPVYNLAVIVLMAAFALARWRDLAHNQTRVEDEQFPRQAANFLLSAPQGPRAFVYYDWGGYTVWRLYPRYAVFVDGRADLYGDDLLQAFKTVVQVKNGWRDVLERWNPETVVVPPSTALAQALMLDPGWRVAYRDTVAVVLTKVEPPARSP